ncbi:MAG: hypothetical protein IKK06_03345 [Clostridia bacterium]|nr:hypothetical protein [Clostridia bacterium]
MVKMHKGFFGENCNFARRFVFLAFSADLQGGRFIGPQPVFLGKKADFSRRPTGWGASFFCRKNRDTPCFLTQYTKPWLMFCENFRFLPLFLEGTIDIIISDRFFDSKKKFFHWSYSL